MKVVGMTPEIRESGGVSLEVSCKTDPALRERNDELKTLTKSQEEVDDSKIEKVLKEDVRTKDTETTKRKTSAGDSAEEFKRENKQLPSIIINGEVVTSAASCKDCEDISVNTSALKDKTVSSASEGDLIKKFTTSKLGQSSELDDMHPHHLLTNILKEKGCSARVRKASSLKDFFLEITDEGIAAFDQDVARAVREKNIPFLRDRKNNGKTLQCSNRFGESLIHMACRRGFTEVVRFFIKEGEVSLRVKDDFGRTPLHDACWSPEPNFELMELLISHDPDLLMIEDVRGHSPFSYARKHHWGSWKKFLLEKRDIIELKSFWEAI
jgi:hypothetical protein